MKTTRILSAAFIATALVGCSQEEQFNMNQDGQMQFIGSFEQVTSRVTMGDDYNLNWEEGTDKVSIFPGITVNNQYLVSSVTGGTASFSFVDYVEPESYSKTEEKLNYALYPYADANSIDKYGTMTASVPAEFTYDGMENSIKTALMAAKSNDGNLSFKNVQGILRLRLNAEQPLKYGAIKSIQIVSKNHALSGVVTITFNESGFPEATLSGDGKTLQLNLSEELKKEVLPKASTGNSSEFYIPVVPTSFEANDVTMTIDWVDEEVEDYTKEIGRSFNIERRKIYTLYHTIGAENFNGDIEDEVASDKITTGTQLLKAIKAGGELTLESDITLNESAVIPEGKTVTLNLNGHTITNPNGYAIENTGNLTISGDGGFVGLGGIRSTGGKITINGGQYTASSKWDGNPKTDQHILKAENTEVVINGGTFDATLGGTNNAMINVSEGSTVTINGGEFKNVNGEIPQFAPYMFTYEKNGKLIINDGDFYGGWRFNGETATTDIYGGNFTVSYDGQSFHANSTHVLTIYGGTFSTNNGGKLNPANQNQINYVAEGYIAVKDSETTWTVVENSSNATIKMQNGATLNLKGIEFLGTIVAEGDLTINGDTKIKTLSATKGGTITIEEGKTLTLNNFSFGSKDNNTAEYTITGGTVTANYGFFQHGKYALRSNFETGYMYYSYGSDITLYGTFHSQGKGDGLDYLRGKLTIANGGKSIHDKSLWVGQPANWGAMNASMTIEEGGYVEVNSLSVYEGSSLYYCKKENLKYNSVNGTDYIYCTAFSETALNEALTNGNNNIALGQGSFTMPATSGDVTISGTKETVITINKPTADKVTLSGVTVQGSGNYTGIQHSEEVIYENCLIKGVQFLYANNVSFKNCVIDLTDVVDYIWTYGAKNVVFDNCIFNTNGKAILIYSEEKALKTNVTVKNCTFNATASAIASGATAAAIEIDSSLATDGHYTLKTENNTVDTDFSGEWRIKKSGTNNTTVNDVVYNAITIDGVTQ